MRHYDLADRTRNRFTGQVDFVADEALDVQRLAAGVGKDDFGDSYFGLQEIDVPQRSFGADFQQPNGLGAGATYNFERYSGLQRSRSASPGQQQFRPIRTATGRRIRRRR